MRYPVEVRLDIRIDYQTAAGFEPFVNLSWRLMCTLPGPKSVREVFKVRLEQWFDNDLHRCLHYTIDDDWDAERALRAVRLRDINSPNRQGLIAPPGQLLLNAAQERVCADF